MHCVKVLCGILHSREKEQMITPHNNWDETHRHDAAGWGPNRRQYIVDNSIIKKLKNRQN